MREETKRKLVVGGLVVALGVGAVAISPSNPVGRVIDYAQYGSRLATATDYIGFEQIQSMLASIKGEIEEHRKLKGNLEGKALDFSKPAELELIYKLHDPPGVRVGVNHIDIKIGDTQIQYIDDNEDGNVETFELVKSGRMVVSIHSKSYWERKYIPRFPGFNETQKYMDGPLQDRVNRDYQMLREIGIPLRGKLTRGFLEVKAK